MRISIVILTIFISSLSLANSTCDVEFFPGDYSMNGGVHVVMRGGQQNSAGMNLQQTLNSYSSYLVAGLCNPAPVSNCDVKFFAATDSAHPGVYVLTRDEKAFTNGSYNLSDAIVALSEMRSAKLCR